MNKLAVYGASGHGKVVADIARGSGYEEIIFIDDGDNKYMNFDIFSKQYINISVALAIGENRLRSKIFEKIKKAGFEIITLIDPSAKVSSSAKIDKGAMIMPGVIINADAHISQGAIINSGAVVEHDVLVGLYSHISPNVSLAGGVKIGNFTHIGIGSCVIQNITIGDDVIVGAGSVVVRDIEDGVVVVGNPARKIKAQNER